MLLAYAFILQKRVLIYRLIDPKGVVLIEGERWRAILDGGHAEPEEEVIITKVEGLKLCVTKKDTPLKIDG